MTFRLILRFGSILLMGVLAVVAAAFVVAPALPGAGQIGFSADSTCYMLDVARGLRYPLLDAACAPQWSPDGQQMVYVQHTDTSPASFDRLVLSNGFAGAAQVLYPTAVPDGLVEHLPAWSPFDSQIAFTYGRVDSTRLDLVVMRPGGAPQTGNISGLLPHNAALSWTAADRLRFVTMVGGAVRLNELRLSDFESSVVREWPFETMAAQQPVLSSDGQRFVLPAITPTALNFELYLFDSPSGEVRNLSDRPAHNDSNAVWSPDGQHILFRSMNDAGHYLVLIGADGSNPTNVAYDKSALFSQVLWSPDGQRASFLMSHSGSKQLCIVELATRAVSCPAEQVDLAAWRPMPSSG